MLKELFNLSGRAALVTGGSKGIGKAVARGLAEAGANVAISARNEDELKKAKAEMADGLSVNVEYFVADMFDRAAVKRLAAPGFHLSSSGRISTTENGRPYALSDFDSVTRSGRMPARSKLKNVPVRPQPAWMSSTISRME
jgi:NAD(P)-dependent dehydrogenase (short-subunit alcohol dehydrogenase family)